MLSSIFNSSIDHSSHGWGRSWAIALIAMLIWLLMLETSLRQDGWEPSMSDSPLLWAKQRARATKLGDKAFIIVGASRSQLALDLDIIRNTTRLEPVQLSIDGSSFLPVLKDLAEDENINGTVLVSFSAVNLSDDGESERSAEWVRFYHQQFKREHLEPYRIIDAKIGDWLTSRLSSRLMGAQPLTVLLAWLNDSSHGAGNYLMMSPDRSRMGDYSKVRMPEFYLQRVARSLGRNWVVDSQKMSNDELIVFYEQIINRLPTATDQDVAAAAQKLTSYIDAIEGRGGAVTLIRFPIGKLVGRILETRYPRDLFWDMAIGEHKAAIHFRDYPALSALELPDGSHPDMKDRPHITKAVLQIMQNQKKQ